VLLLRYRDLPHQATEEIKRKRWSRGWDLNPWPADYEMSHFSNLICFRCVYVGCIRDGLGLVGPESCNASCNVNKLGKSPAGCGADEAKAKLVDVRRPKSFGVAEYELLCECWREARETRHGAITSIPIEYGGVPVIVPKAHDRMRLLGRPLPDHS